ncbi:FIST signal transduction protein [Actinoplanes solisilvae]|uniref:FIST signal transduction protein n=1 Tax=Actinoplanes solisilvae TaxID=2486853 RepID=UPI00196AD3CA|nr:FIST N-terminal domain-containing protein [Actinoplanes solisilvae]
MDLFSMSWHPDSGWSTPFPPLDGAKTLVLAFGSGSLADDPTPIRELCAAFPSATVIGCSSAGEITGDTVTDGSLAVSVVRFEHTRIRLVSEKVADAGESYDVGFSVAKQLTAEEPDLRAVFVVSDGLQVNGSPLVAGLAAGAGPGVIISGGLAADGDRFERTWVLIDGEPRSGHVTAVGLAGPHIRVTTGSRGGWDIFGPRRLVTRSDGNILSELDGQPALELYKRYLGERAAGLPATALLFPLAIWTPEAPDRRVVRTVLAIDENAQSMTFAGDVPVGSTVQLMRASLDRLIDGASDAASQTATDLPPGALTVAVSCVGRRLILGGRTEDELEAVLSGLPPQSHLVGFYSYGEIAPIVTGTCDLHNQTMTLTSFWETGDEDSSADE